MPTIQLGRDQTPEEKEADNERLRGRQASTKRPSRQLASAANMINTTRERPGGFAKSEDELTKAFAGMKRQAGARFGESGRQLKTGLERMAARTQREGGESFGKALETGTAALGREQASLEAGIDAQEAQAKGALQEQKRGFEERSMERQSQAEQIKATLQLQENSFAHTMDLEWAGMSLNEQVTWFNAAMAQKQAGIETLGDWNAIVGTNQSMFGEFFPNTVGFSHRPAARTQEDFRATLVG